MTNSGEINRPVPWSPRTNESTKRRPSTPLTGLRRPDDPVAGPSPNASPERVQDPK